MDERKNARTMNLGARLVFLERWMWEAGGGGVTPLPPPLSDTLGGKNDGVRWPPVRGNRGGPQGAKVSSSWILAGEDK